MVSNFPGWIGPHEVADFHRQFPQASVYMNTSMPSTIAGTVELIKNNPGAYDAALGDLPTLGQMKAAGVYQTPDWAAIPNLSQVDAVYRKTTPTRSPTTMGSASSATARTSSLSPSPAGPTSGSWPPASTAAR